MDAANDSDASSDFYQVDQDVHQDVHQHVDLDTSHQNKVGHSVPTPGVASSSPSLPQSLDSLGSHSDAQGYSSQPITKRRRLSQSPDSSAFSYDIKKPKISHSASENILFDAVSQTKGSAVAHAPSQAITPARIMIANDIYSDAAPPTKGVPAEVWQHVFSFLAVDDLARCNRVCTGFEHYLIGVDEEAPTPTFEHGLARLTMIKSESIWSHSRQNFTSGLASPVVGLSERQMLSFLGNTGCERCDDSPDSVRHVWPFAQRLCQPCFAKYTVRDTDLLKSGNAYLAPGLPHGFRTATNEYVLLRTASRFLNKPLLYKVFYDRQIQDFINAINNAFSQSNEEGSALKSDLRFTGKKLMTDVDKWEAWEDSLWGLKSTRLAFLDLFESTQGSTTNVAGLPSMPLSSATSMSSVPMVQSSTMTHPLPQRIAFTGQPISAPIPASAQPYPWEPQPTERKPRSLEEVERAKAMRRTAIDYRCYTEFYPPLTPNVLAHMESYNAAVSIPQALTEEAWVALKPRLETQRDAAELVEHERVQRLHYLQAAMPSSQYPYQHQNIQNAGDSRLEKEQESFRKELASHADSLVRDSWANGGSITTRNYPNFAADVLKRTYEDFCSESGNAHKRVTLDTMKWIYDNKVKIYTARYASELFLCADCGDENKWYAFEGLIQHFGAKHTDDFSKGNIVVHWQTATWPSYSPFVEHPVEREPMPQPRWRAPKHNPHITTMASTSNDTTQSALWPAKNGQSSINNTMAPSDNMNDATSEEGEVFDPLQFDPRTRDTFDVTMELEAVAANAVDIWEKLSGIRDIETSVMLKALIHHVSARYKAMHGHSLTINVFIAALRSRTEMSPIRLCTGLACNTCVSSNLGSGPVPPYAERLDSNEIYNLMALLEHFQDIHLTRRDAYHWMTDLLEVPEDQAIRELIKQPGMNDEKLAIIEAAFPGTWGKSLPHIGTVTDESWELNQQIKELKAKQKVKPKTKLTKKQKRNLAKMQNDEAKAEDSERSLPIAGEDEYDPSRPDILFPPTSHDRRTYNRSSHHQNQAVQQGAGPLTAESISFLANLVSQQPNTGNRAQDRERSPAFGRAASPGDGGFRYQESEEEHVGRGRRRVSGRGKRRNDVYTEPIPDVMTADDYIPEQPVESRQWTHPALTSIEAQTSHYSYPETPVYPGYDYYSTPQSNPRQQGPPGPTSAHFMPPPPLYSSSQYDPHPAPPEPPYLSSRDIPPPPPPPSYHEAPGHLLLYDEYGYPVTAERITPIQPQPQAQSQAYDPFDPYQAYQGQNQGGAPARYNGREPPRGGGGGYY